MSSRMHGLMAMLAAAFAVATPVAAADDTRPLSPAQIALFESDHLRGIERPARLEYRFRREAAVDTSGPAASFVDRVDLDVRPRAGGGKDVWADFLSGDHHMPFPPLMDFHGNPVVMFFLEHDVEEMHRATGGAAAYFRNRIRAAFVDRAQLREVELLHDGKPVPGTEITLAPFREDPRIAVFPGLTNKLYRFVLSDAIPGEIFEIGSEVPGGDGQSARLKETMTFAGEHACAGAEGTCEPTAPK